jgi:NADH:ubiquinone oxidoreductase subunit E
VTRITVCMGSSCFARGNNRNLELLLEYLDKRGLRDQVQLKGTLCEGRCSQGPTLLIDDQLNPRIDPVSLVGLLDHHFRRPPPRGEP